MAHKRDLNAECGPYSYTLGSQNENKQLIALLNAFLKKIIKQHILVIGRDRNKSDMRELRT